MNDITLGAVVFLGGVAFVLLLVFLVLREFWTWYWKQSEQVRLLKRIADSLERLEGRGGGFSPSGAEAHAAAVRLGLAPPPPLRPRVPQAIAGANGVTG